MPNSGEDISNLCFYCSLSMSKLSKNFFKMQGAYFRFLGFDIADGEQGWQYPWKTLWCMLPLAGVQPMIVAYIIVNAGSVDKVDRMTEAIASILLDLLSLFKLGLMIWQHKEYRRLIVRFRSMLTQACDDWIPARIINEENEREQRISQRYKWSFLLTGALSALMPLITTMMMYLNSGVLQPQNSFPCVYPWNNEHLQNALFSYLFTVAAIFGVISGTICMDAFFMSLTHNLVALFKVAQYHMQLNTTTLQQTQTRLGVVFQLYKDTVDISTAVKHSFRPLVCVQLVIASLHLCVIGYTLSMNFNQVQMPFYVMFTMSVLSQLGMYCYCGQQVKTESIRFAEAIYDCPWYKSAATSPAIGLSLRISMMRAQRGCIIDGYFFDANMEVFLTIVRKSMSYFTLLRSIS
ncbi:putative odorant receptor 98b [Drosophila busckii]|uniref:putative odorant receptor 98b n=1 Tax=Drosophila busckii TaxID=30019 RepID=UPI001432CBCF|nr:putative odorant receptor 98b [Drosophila busckii]